MNGSGKQYLHKGCIDILRNFVEYYPFPEQCYLTQHFSGNWKMIDGLYASWGHKNDSLGMHMAGLKYLINGEMKEYKAWQIQIPEDDGFNPITNLVAIWGLENYPMLHKYLMKELKIRIDYKLINFKDADKNKMNVIQQKLFDLLKFD